MAQEIKIATFNVGWMVNLFKNGKPDLSTRLNKHRATTAREPTSR